MDADRKEQHKLQEFAEWAKHSEEEMCYLRDASGAFGQLAERLSASLQQELRKTRNNLRQWERMKNDRRYSTVRLPRERANNRD
jgi:hypothetical protein